MPYLSALSALSCRSVCLRHLQRQREQQGKLKLRALCVLCVRYIITTQMFCFRLFLVSCSYLRICHKNIIFAFRNYKLGRL